MSLWLREPGEADDAWVAFQRYLGQAPPRRMAAVLGFPTARVGEWHNRHSWRDRAAAHDEHLAAIVQEEKEAAARQQGRTIAEEHLRILHAARGLIQRELDKLAAISQDNENPAMRIGDLAKLLDLELKYSRLLAGESTENVSASVDLSNLSVEELQVLRKLRTGVPPPGVLK